MVSSIDPAALGAAAHLHTFARTAPDSAGAKMFADLMKGAGVEPEGAAASQASAASSPTRSAGGTAVDMIQQLSGQNDLSDPIKSQYMLMDVFGQRMEFLGRMHITMALANGATGVFKQLFNRHD
jgi:hypothetical protein